MKKQHTISISKKEIIYFICFGEKLLKSSKYIEICLGKAMIGICCSKIGKRLYEWARKVNENLDFRKSQFGKREI